MKRYVTMTHRQASLFLSTFDAKQRGALFMPLTTVRRLCNIWLSTRFLPFMSPTDQLASCIRIPHRKKSA